MRVIDGHCDVLSKMLLHPHIDFEHHQVLDVTLSRMKQANLLMQCFAIFVPQEIKLPTFDHLLQMIEIFHKNILNTSEIVFVRTIEDLNECRQDGKTGAMLTLESVDALHGNLKSVQTLFDYGVRALGLTWNYANWAADGVLEPRQGGLTTLGRQLIRECNRLQMILDVSHLSENAFWELNEITTRPYIASHSNAYHICKHPRNLKDDQIMAIIQQGGRIGLTFVPYFLNETGNAKISDLIHHLDHICALGGSQHLCFGSDFDGMDRWTQQLEHPGKFRDLESILLKYYQPHEVEGFLWRNWYEFFFMNLP